MQNGEYRRPRCSHDFSQLALVTSCCPWHPFRPECDPSHHQLDFCPHYMKPLLRSHEARPSAVHQPPAQMMCRACNTAQMCADKQARRGQPSWLAIWTNAQQSFSACSGSALTFYRGLQVCPLPSHALLVHLPLPNDSSAVPISNLALQHVSLLNPGCTLLCHTLTLVKSAHANG